MTIENYWDRLSSNGSWSVIELEDCFISVNDLEPNIICSNGRCWAPPPTDLEEHILIIKRV